MRSSTPEGAARPRRPQHARPRPRRRRSRWAPAPPSSSSAPAGTGRGAPRARSHPAALPVVQEEQRGSGHAAAVALAAVPDLEGPVLLRQRRRAAAARRTVAGLVGAHVAAGHALTVLTAEVDDPTGLGRIVRDGDGARRGRSSRSATPPTSSGRSARSTPASTSATPARCAACWPARRRNDQGEQYVTDVLGAAGRGRGAGRRRPRRGPGRRPGLQRPARAGRAPPDAQRPRAGRPDARRRHRRRPADHLGRRDGEVAPDAVLQPGTQLHGRDAPSPPARSSGPTPRWSTARSGRAPPSSARTACGAVIGPEATVGPFSYLRPGTRLGRGAKVGAFVETKNVEVGEGSKVPHLSYVGDATIGRGAQHRRGDRVRELRRRRQAPHDGRRPRAASARTRCWSRRSPSGTAPTPRPGR